MPRNLSAWIDLTIHLVVMLVLVGLLFCYNTYLAAAAFMLWLCLAFFAGERCADRARRFEHYCKQVIRSVNEMMNYAVEELPQGIIVINEKGRVEWANEQMANFVGIKPEQDTAVKELWPDFSVENIWGKEGEFVLRVDFRENETKGERFLKIHHSPVKSASHVSEIMALYIEDVSKVEQLKKEYAMSRTSLIYIEIDNYDEVMQGLSEAERTALLLAVNEQLDEWINTLGGFMRRISDDLYVVILERKNLDKAIADKFQILDKVRSLESTNRIPVTLSMGVSVAKSQTMMELGKEAQAELDLALGRGGDQVAALVGGKTQFFGGKSAAVEKHTRVKARVVSHALREIMEGSDEIYIMGHHNEDFDCFGAAMGIAKMASHLKKTFHIVLSDMNEGIDKFADLLKGKEEYDGVFMRQGDFAATTALSPLLIVVDTHIPHLVAAPEILERIHRVVVIDHHRRSESVIKNPLLIYIEPSSSSTSEIVTEMLMYFSEEEIIGGLDATALYSGIVVDTKNFTVQTGVRTFDAAAYLKRSGADPVIVRHLFRSDYDTTVSLAKALANSEYYEGGLIVSVCPGIRANIQVVAAQAADALLRVENVRMSIVCFQLKEDVVGISARSSGEMNVQVIMEAFGGGGHQNVAGAQIKNGNLNDIKQKVIEISTNYIKEADKDESNLT